MRRRRKPSPTGASARHDTGLVSERDGVLSHPRDRLERNGHAGAQGLRLAAGRFWERAVGEPDDAPSNMSIDSRGQNGSEPV